MQCILFDVTHPLQATTTIPADGYTQLARPFGRSVAISDTFTADNSWVVPHNRYHAHAARSLTCRLLIIVNMYLLVKYDAHINVEASASIAVVKYMFSYIYKGT